MLNRRQCSAILELHAKKFTKRRIAKALQISRPTVKDVIDSNSCEVPVVLREEKAEPYRQQILDLHAPCKGNKVRVHEELVASGAAISYPALTAFCRREQIGHKPAVPSGEYEFDPGEETQHDTSPFRNEVGGTRKQVQIVASALCFSQMLFFQCCPCLTRFECKVFLYRVTPRGRRVLGAVMRFRDRSFRKKRRPEDSRGGRKSEEERS